MKNKKTLENGLGVVGGGPDWSKMISAIVRLFLNRFWAIIIEKELQNVSFSENLPDHSPNSACTMGFWRFQGLVSVFQPRAVPGHAKSLKNLKFLSFFKKNGAGARVLRSTFLFFDECFTNLLVLVAKLGVTPQLGLQRHLASNGAPKGFQRVPKVSKRITKITRAIVNINDGKRKIDFLMLF